MESKEIIQAYIEKAMKLKEQNTASEELTRERLMDIAAELGFNENDFKLIERLAEDSIIRGKNWMNNECREEALAEFSTANILRPGDPEILSLLAHCHFVEFRAKGNKQDRKQAESFARQCISIDPDHKDAFKLLSQIKTPEKSASHPPRGKKAVHLLVMGILFLGILSFILLYKESPPETRGITDTVMEAENTENILEAVVRDSGKSIVPAVFHPTNGLTMNIRESILSRYEDSFSFELKGDIATSRDAVTELKCKVSLYNNTGTLLYAGYMTPKQDYEPTMIPGDTLPASILIYEEEPAPAITKAEVTVDFILTEPFSGPEEYPSLTLEWGVPRRNGMDLELGLRENNISSGFGNTYHTIAIEIENTGTQSISILKFAAEWYNDEGNMMKRNESYGGSTSDPSFLPGQKRSAIFIQSFENYAPGPDDFKIKVIEIR